MRAFSRFAGAASRRLAAGIATVLFGLGIPGLGTAVEGHGPDYGEPGSACADPGPDHQRIISFLVAGCYKDWAHDPEPRSTGPLFFSADGAQHSEATHHRVIVYYSSAVVGWLRTGKPETGIADNAMIIKETYQTSPYGPGGDKLLGWAAIYRDRQGSWDGWFWSLYFFDPDVAFSRGQFGYADCLSCHAMTETREVTFADILHLDGRVIEKQVLRPLPEEGLTLGSNVHARKPDAVGVDSGDEIVAAEPRRGGDPAFIELYGRAFLQPPPEGSADDAAVRELAAYVDARAGRFPPVDASVAPAGPHGPDTFLTSDQCAACHDADFIFDAEVPDEQFMVARDADGTFVDLSPHGEWSVSLMGLAGRDPVFHAQLESEKVRRPEMRAFADNTCYKCHGVMGLRQLAIDQAGRPFQHAMIYAGAGTPNAKYGALGRDGVSCTVCHHIAPDDLGTPASFTANFKTGQADEVYGPFPRAQTLPMEHALGITPKLGSHIEEAALCGSCHTVVLPKLSATTPYGGADPYADASVEKVHEQTTYLEWRNSAYAEPGADGRTCQACHMPERYGDDDPLSFRIAKVLDDGFRRSVKENAGFEVLAMAPPDKTTLTPRSPFARHTLVGNNLFVMAMFRQFGDLLGALPDGADERASMLKRMDFAIAEAAHQATTATATVALSEPARDGADLVVRATVTNLAGHKFPSGVGFRRAFLRVRVLDDDGKPLWVSGDTSPMGVILDGANGAPLATEFSMSEVQPHHAVISRQDQAQIYEERHKNDAGQLTTSFLGLQEAVKDNRLLPKGWRALDGADPGIPADAHDDMMPHGTDGDTDYSGDASAGADTTEYRIPLAAIDGAASVEADLFYQTLPPYYLRDVFENGDGVETNRLFYIASHLELAGTTIDNWRLRIGGARKGL